MNETRTEGRGGVGRGGHNTPPTQTPHIGEQEIERSLRLWLTVMPDKSWTNWRWGWAALYTWWQAREDQQKYTMDHQDILDWIFDVYDGGLSMDKARNALYAIDAWRHVHGQNGYLNEPWMKTILRRLNAKWKKKAEHKDRLPLGQAFASVAAATPMPKTDPRLWACFTWITWVFALRQPEVRHVRPTDVKYDPVLGNWHCTVTHPKVNEWKKNQVVTIHKKWVPKPAQQALRRFMAYGWGKPNLDVPWDQLIPKEKPTQHLKYLFSDQLNRYAVVWHGLRHGRVTELFRVHGWTEAQVQQFGRWRSRSSMLIYLH